MTTSERFSSLLLPGNDGNAANDAETELNWHPAIGRAIASLPRGTQPLRGIPFNLPDLDRGSAPAFLAQPSQPTVLVPIAVEQATWLVFAHFCGVSRDAASDEPTGFVRQPGTVLASYTLLYTDGGEVRVPIRRRYEINDVAIAWGQLGFACVPHRSNISHSWRGPHQDGAWGRNQAGAEFPDYSAVAWAPSGYRPVGNYWLYALENPRPNHRLTGLRLEATGAEWVVVGGITLVRDGGNPLRVAPLVSLLVTNFGEDVGDRLTVDLGLVARALSLSPTKRRAWLTSTAGLGEAESMTHPPPKAVQVAAAEGALVAVDGAEVTLRQLLVRRRVQLSNGVRIERLLEPDHRWSFDVRDDKTGGLIPARVHFRTLEGRYLPPEGHRQEVNDRWFEDYGADLTLGGFQYAYVPGSFDIQLPRSEVLVEVWKGFEYEPSRYVFDARASRSEATSILLTKARDMRLDGWISGDTHVHFLSPETALLEAQGEDVNIVNLLAAQWGDMFTNVGDYTAALPPLSCDDTLVWVGTENRQHLLGHLSLLGIRGGLPAPLSSAGPDESYFGGRAWVSIADWAREARARDGLVVVPHFPNPECEVVADAILGLIDAVEIRDFWSGIDTPAIRAWYRLLNCGLRIPVVGGTDKMSAGMPVGGVRTYARTSESGVSWTAWADAIRAGRTFTTSGPLLTLSVDGRGIGDTVLLGGAEATLGVHASAECWAPLDHLELVYDGQVVGSAEAAGGRVELRTSLKVHAGGWLAARCASKSIANHAWPVYLAAHTSPVYIGGARRPAAAEDIAHLRGILAGGIVWADALATASSRDRTRLRSAFGAALRAIGTSGLARRPSPGELLAKE